jgi:hypothetical protein
MVTFSAVLILLLSSFYITSATNLKRNNLNVTDTDYEECYTAYGRNFATKSGTLENEGTYGVRISPGGDWCRVKYKIPIHSDDEGIIEGSLKIKVQYRNEENPSSIQIYHRNLNGGGSWITLDKKMGNKDDSKRWWESGYIESSNSYIQENSDDISEVHIRFTAEGDGILPGDWKGEDTTIFQIKVIYQEKDDLDYSSGSQAEYDKNAVVKQQFTPDQNSITKIKIGFTQQVGAIPDSGTYGSGNIDIKIHSPDEVVIVDESIFVTFIEQPKYGGPEKYVLIDISDIEVISGKLYYISAQITNDNGIYFSKNGFGRLCFKTYSDDSLTWGSNLKISDSNIDLVYPHLSSQTISIINNGDKGSCFEWTASENCPWITIDKKSGIVHNPYGIDNNRDSIEISVNGNSQRKNVEDKITITTSDGQSSEIQISMMKNKNIERTLFRNLELVISKFVFLESLILNLF